MGRTLLVGRTSDYGDLIIPCEEVLAVQLKQSIIHYAFWRRRYPEFRCHLFSRDRKAEVYELFVEYDGVSRIPGDHFDTLLNMGVSYLNAFELKIEDFMETHHREPVLIPIDNDKIDRVALVV